MTYGHKFVLFLAGIGTLLIAGLAGCQSEPTAKHYALEGEVISVTPGGTAVAVKHGDIPGFMSAMTMSYAAADPKEAEKLQPGDKIKADLVVSKGKTHLEKIVVTEKAKPESTAPGEPKHSR